MIADNEDDEFDTDLDDGDEICAYCGAVFHEEMGVGLFCCETCEAEANEWDGEDQDGVY